MFNFLFNILPLFRIKVKEKSMKPFLKEGDMVLSIKYFFTNPKVGDVIIFHHPTPPFMFIKRITKIIKNKYWVEGDNKKFSHDSRKFGFINRKDILGKIIYKI